MLEEFSALKTEVKKPEVTSGPGRPTSAVGATEKEPTLEAVLSDDDFAKELEASMANLLGKIETTPEMQSQFEAIFKEISAAAGTADDMPLPTASASTAKATPTPGAAAAPSAAASSSAAAKEADFQETIRRTMERMQASGEQATAAATEAGADDILSELMKAMQSGGLDGAEGGEEEFSKLLLGMMEQLTNKDILYEPMKELDEKFPAWMEKNRGKVSAEDLKKYEEQQSLAKEIVAKFEEPTFSDANPKDREYIVDRMQKVSQKREVTERGFCALLTKSLV
jgi:peroxin-19